jgi:Protein of unknown function (DUF2752)
MSGTETQVSAAADSAIAGYLDTRSRRRRMIAPTATIVGTAAALGYLGMVDPSEPGHYPLCPTNALLGVDCPGCGMLRGTHALLTGDVPRALDHNLLLLVLVPLTLVLLARWTRQAWRGVVPDVSARAFRLRTRVIVVGMVLVLAFGVLRNLLPYLGSGIG